MIHPIGGFIASLRSLRFISIKKIHQQSLRYTRVLAQHMSTDSINYGDGEVVHAMQVPTDQLDQPLEPNAEQSQPETTPGKKFPFGWWILGLLLFLGVGWIVLRNVILPILIFSNIKPQATPVQLSNPKAATIDNTSDYVANLQSRQSITLKPRVSGQIVDIYVKSGDRVGAGEPVLQIDAADQQAEVDSQVAATESSRAQVEIARAEAANARDALASLRARRNSRVADVEFSREEYNRYADLYKQGASSKQVLDQKQNALRSAESALDQVDADIRAQESSVLRAESNIASNQRSVERAESTVEREQVELGRYSVTAPIDGIVGDVPVKIGDYITTTSELLTITQNRQLEVQIDVPTEKAPDLKLGLPVELLGADNKPLQRGRISFVAPNVNPSTQSVQAKAVFNNTSGQLRANQFLRARIIWSTRPGVMVPTSAISRLGGQNFVFVQTAYKDTDCDKQPQTGGFGGPPPKPSPDQPVAYQKPVQLGKIIGNDQEVLEGLTPSDRIIPSGILALQNCVQIVDAATVKK